MKFYPSDWRADPMLRLCSLAARGLWCEMMCLMHEAEPYGSLLVNGKRIDKKQLASLVGVSERECTALLIQLTNAGVYSRDDDGTLYSRRMRRDKAKATKDKSNGKGGGNPALTNPPDKGGVNPPDNPPVKGGDKAQSPESRDQRSDSSDADASGAEAPRDFRSELFSIGLKKLATITGKGPGACRSFVGKCLKASGDDAIVVLGLIEDAERNQVINPSAWIAARLKPVEIRNGKAQIGGSIVTAGHELSAHYAREAAAERAARDDLEAGPDDVLRVRAE
jgi:hypothetical protein